jgi:hypothetical protein
MTRLIKMVRPEVRLDDMFRFATIAILGAMQLVTPAWVVGQVTGRGSLASPRPGVQAKGWSGRIDAKAERGGRKLADARVWDEGETLHIVGSPPAIYWRASSRAKGTYDVQATFTQPATGLRTDAFGIFIGGTNLNGRQPNYLYCLVSGDGTFQVLHALGEEAHSLAGRTSSAAIRRVGGAAGIANEVSWRVTGDRITCAVNGSEVWSYGRASVIGPGKLETLDGITGLRLETNLAMRVSGFTVRASR